MKRSLALLLLVTASTLPGCGFQPMYGSHSLSANGAESGVKANTGLSQVDIAIMPDREGQILRNELIDLIQSRGPQQTTRYNLTFSDLIITIRELDLTKNSEATRSQIIAATTVTLTDIETGKPLMSRAVKSISSYNVLPSKFATRVTEDNARTSSLKDLARQIETQLTLYFNR